MIHGTHDSELGVEQISLEGKFMTKSGAQGRSPSFTLKFMKRWICMPKLDPL